MRTASVVVLAILLARATWAQEVGRGCVGNPARVDAEGVRIEWLKATPSPCRVLARRTSVKLEFQLRYSLLTAQTGSIVLWFTDTRGNSLTVSRPGGGVIDAVSVPIVKGVGTVETFSIDIVVPDIRRDLLLRLAVADTEGRHRLSRGDVWLLYKISK